MLLLIDVEEEAAEEAAEEDDEEEVAGWSKKNKNPTWQCGELKFSLWISFRTDRSNDRTGRFLFV